MKDFYKNKVIFITGGTGSFGKELVIELLNNYKIKKIIIYSRDELKQFDFKNYLENIYGVKKIEKYIRFFVGDIRDKERLLFAINDVDFLIHAAALKQVTTAEYNPFEAVKTNIFGSQNVIDCSLEKKVKRVIALSTDKAAAPLNLYGATKLTADKLFISSNNYRGSLDIKFSVVRYGNVMNSRGSVIPFFLSKKKENILPVTDKRMTRFNIPLIEGVRFVLQSMTEMFGGELFVPKLPSYNIMDLAKAIAPNARIKIIGIREGEKLHEEMITSHDSYNTVEHKNKYVVLPNSKYLSWNLNDYKKKYKFIKFCKDGFSYNSSTNKNFLTVAELRKLLNKQKFI